MAVGDDRVHDRVAAREEPSAWWVALAGMARVARLYPGALIVLVALALWWRSGVWLWPVVAVIVIGVGWWQRERLRARRRRLRFAWAWSGTAGQVGHAAAMGLVGRDHRVPQVVDYVEHQRGRTVTLLCPPSVPVARVVDSADDLRSLWEAVAITPVTDPRTRAVTLQLIDRDATAETVEAPWVTAIDDGTPLPDASICDDATPWWESDPDTDPEETR